MTYRLLLAFALSLSGCASRSDWKPVSTPSGTVWRADRGAWRAEVEPSRGRLTFLGKIDGKNLLNRPRVPVNNLDFGGHRLWLGPQAEWTPIWPPPANWESAPAASVRLLKSGWLEVLSPVGPKGEAAIRRSYRWSREGLFASSVSWKETSSLGRQAMNILQVENSATVLARAKPSAHAPLGFARIPTEAGQVVETKIARPRVAFIRGNQVFLRRGGNQEKLGFLPQPLTARWRTVELIMHPGRVWGLVGSEPDDGFRSQVYLGSDEWPVLEIEQFTPRLRPILPGFAVGQTVTIELRTRK